MTRPPGPRGPRPGPPRPRHADAQPVRVEARDPEPDAAPARRADGPPVPPRLLRHSRGTASALRAGPPGRGYAVAVFLLTGGRQPSQWEAAQNLPRPVAMTRLLPAGPA